MSQSHRDARLALTLGDVAGVGPEVVARAWSLARPWELARVFVVGHVGVLRRACQLVGAGVRVETIQEPEAAAPGPGVIPCLEATNEDLDEVQPGMIDARAGRAARDFLHKAIDLALAGRVDAMTTLPINKESLRAGGESLPGHTEILASRCGVPDHAMMLYVAPPLARGEGGLGVVHATLHVPLRAVFDLLTPARVEATIELAERAMRGLLEARAPRIGVAGLNPHAGEHGLFGDEDEQVIAPAVQKWRARGLDVSGPIAADTLFYRALSGEFDAVVAMYHDQGHAAIKSVAFWQAVNVTLGLPIVRTSVAHGTAFDIAWQGKAKPTSLIEAIRVAARLVEARLESRIDSAEAPDGDIHPRRVDDLGPD